MYSFGKADVGEECASGPQGEQIQRDHGRRRACVALDEGEERNTCEKCERHIEQLAGRSGGPKITYAPASRSG